MKKRNVLMLVCLSALGCEAMLAETDVTTTGGTANTIPVFTGTSAIGNSIMSQSGSVVSVDGAVNASSGYMIGGDNALTQSNTQQAVGVGYGALASSTGDYNTAAGWDALHVNGAGVANAAFGYVSLFKNTTGDYNTAFGPWTLYSNTSGGSNVAVGEQAGYYISSGSSNTAVGVNAGYSLTTGSYNIDIGAQVAGSASDSGVIRIGNSNQTSAYLAGVYGVTTGTTGVEVYVDASGQLGTKSSSIRYKEDVRDMDDASGGLFRLRPVTYRYKQPYADGSKPIDYGLIAEEVAEVYPDMVSKNASGQIETVQYSKLTPMLLNEVQKQHQLLEQQAETIRLLEQRLTALESPSQAAK
jgi:hypothetical protein